jgi:uncharacterized protein YndB with AHSA1/START domain
MWIAFALFALSVAALLAYVARKPDVCAVSRSLMIAAPAEKIFPLIDSPRAMNEWNPFPKADPNIAMSYSGPERGVGAVNDFSGNGQVGAGRAEIIESEAPRKIVVALTMTRPMRCANRVEFTLAPRGEGSLVTWAMTGRQPFIGKLFSLIFDPEKMCGGAFEKGLADLKTLAERA